VLTESAARRESTPIARGKNNAMGNTDKNTRLLRKLAFFVGLCGGAGGVSVDLDHILNMATGGEWFLGRCSTRRLWLLLLLSFALGALSHLLEDFSVHWF